MIRATRLREQRLLADDEASVEGTLRRLADGGGADDGRLSARAVRVLLDGGPWQPLGPPSVGTTIATGTAVPTRSVATA